MYHLEEFEHGFGVTMPAAFNAVDTVCAAVEKFMREHRMTGKHIHEVQLGLREVMSNSIMHGSLGNARHNIFFRLSYDKGNLHIRIRDQGPGFDWRKALSKPVTPLQENGMGLKIIRLCFDVLRFNEAGNEVELIKKVP